MVMGSLGMASFRIPLPVWGLRSADRQISRGNAPSCHAYNDKLRRRFPDHFSSPALCPRLPSDSTS
jgi:hypothetical protein